MVSRRQCMIFGDQVNYSDKILEMLIGETEGESPGAEEIHSLAKDLRHILSLAEGAASGASSGKKSSNLTEILREMREENSWRQFEGFMSHCAVHTPPPPYIYRAERHGDPFHTFVDNVTGEIVSSFASNQHAWMESECESSIIVPIMSPREVFGTVSGLVDGVAMHLKKAQINELRASRGEEQYLSQLVSLSGCFRWAVHTTCLKGLTATEDQEAGLAIFDTSEITARGGSLWRVRDLLTFFKSDKKYGSSRIDNRAEKWALNSDEYFCWDLVPRSALVSFLPFERLVHPSDFPDDHFLRSEFTRAASLGDFKQRVSPTPELLTIDQYQSRVSSLLIDIAGEMHPFTDHVCTVKDVGSFVEIMIENFSDPTLWGYELKGKPEVRAMLRRIITAVYGFTAKHDMKEG